MYHPPNKYEHCIHVVAMLWQCYFITYISPQCYHDIKCVAAMITPPLPSMVPPPSMPAHSQHLHFQPSSSTWHCDGDGQQWTLYNSTHKCWSHEKGVNTWWVSRANIDSEYSSPGEHVCLVWGWGMCVREINWTCVGAHHKVFMFVHHSVRHLIFSIDRGMHGKHPHRAIISCDPLISHTN
jgi:hypothetical protein